MNGTTGIPDHFLPEGGPPEWEWGFEETEKTRAMATAIALWG